MACCAYYTCRVALVDHYESIVFLCKVANLVHRSHVAIHREYTISYDDAETLFLSLLQAALEVGHIGIGVAITLCLTKTYTVNDRSVVECVRDDGILIGEEGFEYTAIGIEASCIEDGVLGLEVVRDGCFELFVEVLK